jgi:hypothetical protein
MVILGLEEQSFLRQFVITIRHERHSGWKSRPATTSTSEKSIPNNSKIQRNPIIKELSLSHFPKASLSDAF